MGKTPFQPLLKQGQTGVVVGVSGVSKKLILFLSIYFFYAFL